MKRTVYDVNNIYVSVDQIQDILRNVIERLEYLESKEAAHDLILDDIKDKIDKTEAFDLAEYKMTLEEHRKDTEADVKTMMESVKNQEQTIESLNKTIIDCGARMLKAEKELQEATKALVMFRKGWPDNPF